MLTRLSFFSSAENSGLLQGLHGLEREALRVTPQGHLAMTAHPKGLGSPLTHPHITTDFSESQIELITPPFSDVGETLKFLEGLHQETVRNLEHDELLWPLSMPCVLPDYGSLPISRYDDSPEGKLRELYRAGLAARYGKMMQMISGVHYNFSFKTELWPALAALEGAENVAEFKNEAYMGVIRNFLRTRWILVYLFGASPEKDTSYSCSKMSFDTSRAVSLRLSRCGYSNPAKIEVSFNGFREHLRDIRRAVDTPFAAYADLKPQVNDHLLQMANEYYAPIRVKPPALKGGLLESLESLEAGYVEVRVLDIDPFSPTGVDRTQLEFIHLLLCFCLLEESPDLSGDEVSAATELQQEVAIHGRDLTEDLRRQGESLLHSMRPVAQVLGKQELLEKMILEFRKAVDRPWKRILTEEAELGEGFLDFGLRKAAEYKTRFL